MNMPALNKICVHAGINDEELLPSTSHGTVTIYFFIVIQNHYSITNKFKQYLF